MSDDPVFQATALSSAYDRIDRLPVVVMLDNIRSLYNVGAFFRTGDAVRVQALLLSGITASPPDARISKTALGAENTVRFERVDPAAAIAAHRLRGYEIAAVETTTRAVDLFDWRPAFPVLVVFGHEVTGVAPELLDACDVHVRIPTLGLKQSLNVATAGGVVLYELLRKYR
jgi:23S rRNA (guanosine2251-2'-O)-methyltransferase